MQMPGLPRQGALDQTLASLWSSLRLAQGLGVDCPGPLILISSLVDI